MNRRAFLAHSAAASSIIAVSGCLGSLTGGNDEEEEQVGHRITDEGDSDYHYLLNRIDFVDQAGTLGQLAHMENDKEVDDLVNTYSEADWQRMGDNDLDVARRTLENNDSNVEQIKPWVEDALDRELEGYPDLESVDAPPGSDEPDERAIMYGIGMGMGEESAISNSFDSAHVLKPLAEKFAAEYLDTNIFEAWITGSAKPATDVAFAHLIITIVYEADGRLRRDYIEPAVPDAPGLGDDPHAIRSPEESIYSDENELEYVTGNEYRKALEMAQNGHVKQEEHDHPVRAISRNLLGNMWSMVDSARNDISYDSPPPHGLVCFVSKEFGRSVEDAFYGLDEQKLAYMRNIGKGMQLFYEEHTGRTNLAVGGTLQKPVFYEFPDEMKDRLWNFEYDTLAELEG